MSTILVLIKFDLENQNDLGFMVPTHLFYEFKFLDFPDQFYQNFLNNIYILIKLDSQKNTEFSLTFP